MENQKLTLQQCGNNRLDLTRAKLALKTPKQDFSELILQNVANVMTVDLKIISKLPGINSDRYDWYLVEVSGTFR